MSGCVGKNFRGELFCTKKTSRTTKSDNFIAEMERTCKIRRGVRGFRLKVRLTRRAKENWNFVPTPYQLSS